MRSSSISIPLALLFCINSVSAQSLISGTWSNPSTSKDSSTYCCIPTSVEVVCPSTGSCTAHYKYPSSINSKCWNLFLSRDNGKMKLYYHSSEYYYSETTSFGYMTFAFSASNATGSPTLNIYSTSSSYYDQCDFKMTSKTAPTTDGIGALIAFFVIVLIIITCCGANKYQKNRVNVLVTQNIAQQPTIVTSYGAPPVYTVPPNQFPNTQVNMNYTGYN